MRLEGKALTKMVEIDIAGSTELVDIYSFNMSLEDTASMKELKDAASMKWSKYAASTKTVEMCRSKLLVASSRCSSRRTSL